jgi:hypothetical protein
MLQPEDVKQIQDMISRARSPQLTFPLDVQTISILKQYIEKFGGASSSSSSSGGSSSGIEGRSHNSSTQTTGANLNGQNILLTFDTNDFANGITWNAASHEFICVTAGVYFVTCSANFNQANLSDGDTYAVSVGKNGSVIFSGAPSAGVQGLVAVCADLVQLVVGDTITFYVVLGGSAAMTINNASGAIAKV